MEEQDLSPSIKKTIKKTNFSGVINAYKYNLYYTSPVKRVGGLRSQSVKKITVFVPQLKPMKSTFVPAPLKLSPNLNFKSMKKEKEDKKQLSDDEIDIISNNSSSSHSSFSSSDFDNLEKDENPEEKIKNKPVLKENKIGGGKKVYSNKFDETYDSFPSGDEKINEDIFNSIRILRRKMSHMKSKAKIKHRETDDTLPNNLIKNFDLELKNEDKDKNNIQKEYHYSVNVFSNINIKPKTKSIFEVISHSNKNLI